MGCVSEDRLWRAVNILVSVLWWENQQEGVVHRGHYLYSRLEKINSSDIKSKNDNNISNIKSDIWTQLNTEIYLKSEISRLCR